MFFSTVRENDGIFWFFNLEKDSVQERPVVELPEHRVQTGTQLNCYRRAAWTAEKQVRIFSRAKLQDAILCIRHGQRPDAESELPWQIC